ncbi:hypothetical protein RHMOL_Rhmol07G0239300 [Rhododendron molle]|uniref:Uncharacterized protein n=1 Tax=Rhododendron molle TaxID=49168 RepID=A0ACC0N4U7_RHOML|nr:hypothetical protein RHMOL_Rhmol07G0239300 [Rhododendron molle]
MGIKFENVFFLVIILVQLFISVTDESSFDGNTFSGASVNEGLVEQEGKADQWYLSHAHKFREHFRLLKGSGLGGGGRGFSGAGMKMSGSRGGGGGGAGGGKKSAASKAEAPTLLLPCMILVVLTLIHLLLFIISCYLFIRTLEAEICKERHMNLHASLE